MASILVVDDRAVNRQFLTTLLRYRGHRLVEAADGSEALEKARSDRPDLVITDILMPTMDGFELVAKLRREKATAQTPVIFYTATYRAHEARQIAEACGATTILPKPSSPSAILAAVDGALAGAKAPAPAPPIPPPPAPAEGERRRKAADQLARHLAELGELNLRIGSVLERGSAAVAEERAPGELSQRLADSTLRIQEFGARLAGALELSLDLAMQREPESLLELFCAGAQDILGARYAALGILADDGATLRHLLARGFDATVLGQVGSEAPRAGLFARLAAEPAPVRLAGLADPGAAGLPAGHPSIRSLLAVQLASSQGFYGWYYLAEEQGADAFSEEDEQLVATLAAQVAVAYENARLYEIIQAHAAQLQLQMAERKRVEAQLREREAEYRLLFESNPHPMWVFDRRTLEFLAVNAEAVRGYGYSREEFRRMTLRDIRPPAEVPLLLEDLAAEVEGRPGPRRQVWTHRRKDGSLLQVKVTSRPIVFRNRAAKLTLATDVSEREHLEAQLRQAQKMEAVGRLAGGIAHDFNNLLTTILGYCELALAEFGDNEALAGELREIEKAGHRATGLTRQLLAFSRRQVLELKVLDLNAVVLDLESMLQRVIGEDIELDALLAPELGRVEADVGQLEQVVLNLVVNARDAMPEGGRLTIETADVELAAGETAERLALAPGPYVRLRIRDTGHGMDPETKSRLFEPFFTTKEPGKGTGLGLATAYGIVQQSGGRIEVESEPGRGATFDIYLPRVGGRRERPAERRPALRGGAETILLIEDEAAVRSLIGHLLESHGYAVLTAGSAGEALAVADAHRGLIDLVLADVVMPGASGPEAVAELRRRSPGAKALYISGYAEGVLEPGASFLQKPFSPENLLRRVREVLDAG